MGTAVVGGYGEVGRALVGVLGEVHRVYVDDPGVASHSMEGLLDPLGLTQPPDVMHVCFPYSDEFLDDVANNHQMYQPEEIIIHSTVPVGTSRRLGALHSPVIGIHPNLAQSLCTFTKFLGGPDSGTAAEHLRRAGMRVYTTSKQETTELMKLMSTLYYATCVEFTKDVKRMCDEADVPFELWTLWTQTYNDGYVTLQRPEFRRPNLDPISGKIGGHCLLPNAELIESDFAELVKERNK